MSPRECHASAKRRNRPADHSKQIPAHLIRCEPRRFAARIAVPDSSGRRHIGEVRSSILILINESISENHNGCLMDRLDLDTHSCLADPRQEWNSDLEWGPRRSETSARSPKKNSRFLDTRPRVPLLDRQTDLGCSFFAHIPVCSSSHLLVIGSLVGSSALGQQPRQDTVQPQKGLQPAVCLPTTRPNKTARWYQAGGRRHDAHQSRTSGWGGWEGAMGSMERRDCSAPSRTLLVEVKVGKGITHPVPSRHSCGDYIIGRLRVDHTPSRAWR